MLRKFLKTGFEVLAFVVICRPQWIPEGAARH